MELISETATPLPYVRSTLNSAYRTSRLPPSCLICSPTFSFRSDIISGPTAIRVWGVAAAGRDTKPRTACALTNHKPSIHLSAIGLAGDPSIYASDRSDEQVASVSINIVVSNNFTILLLSIDSILVVSRYVSRYLKCLNIKLILYVWLGVDELSTSSVQI
jgi:hypothetical protein